MSPFALPDAGLLGHDRKRAIASFGVALTLFVVSFLAGSIAESNGVTNDWFARFPLAVLASFVAIGVLAAGVAYWNGGLASSWFVAFAAAFGWLSNVLVGEGTVLPGGVVAPLGLAGGVAVTLGTIGYAIGRSLRVRTTGDEQDALPEPLLRILLGNEPDQLISWGTRAVGLFFATAALVYVTSPDASFSIGTFEPVEGLVPAGGLSGPFVFGTVAIPGWLAVATWPAYRSEGLLAGWILLFGPFFGAWVTDDVLLGRLTGSGPLVDAVLVLLGAFVLAVVLGTAGFVLGSSLRRVAE